MKLDDIVTLSELTNEELSLLNLLGFESHPLHNTVELRWSCFNFDPIQCGSNSKAFGSVTRNGRRV